MKEINRMFKGESCYACFSQKNASHTQTPSGTDDQTDAMAITAQPVFFPRFISTENNHSTQLTASSDIAAANLHQLTPNMAMCLFLTKGTDASET